MKLQNLRAIHRDLGYFYVGLIISFSLSGIILNHRGTWHPERFTMESKEVQVELPTNEKDINEQVVQELASNLEINDKIRRFFIRNNELRMSFNDTELNINTKTGQGDLIKFIKTPLISQSLTLHKNTSKWWIYYSDIFGLSMIIIAVTGMLMFNRGKYTFKQRGWKLAVAGILFPILFLVFLL